MEVSTRAVGFSEEGVNIEREGEKRVIGVDAVVLAVGQKPRQELAAKLEGQIKEIHVVGDCAKVRKLRDAVHEGARAGREV